MSLSSNARFDGGAYEDCDSGTYTASELTEGTYTFDVRAIDGALTDQTPASDSVIIDVTAPDVAITSTPVAISNDANPVFEFESTDPSATFTCAINAGDFEPCESGDSFGPLTDGDYAFYVRSFDPGGNVGAQDQLRMGSRPDPPGHRPRR